MDKRGPKKKEKKPPLPPIEREPAMTVTSETLGPPIEENFLDENDAASRLGFIERDAGETVQVTVSPRELERLEALYSADLLIEKLGKRKRGAKVRGIAEIDGRPAVVVSRSQNTIEAMELDPTATEGKTYGQLAAGKIRGTDFYTGLLIEHKGKLYAVRSRRIIVTSETDKAVISTETHSATTGKPLDDRSEPTDGEIKTAVAQAKASRGAGAVVNPRPPSKGEISIEEEIALAKKKVREAVKKRELYQKEAGPSGGFGPLLKEWRAKAQVLRRTEAELEEAKAAHKTAQADCPSLDVVIDEIDKVLNGDEVEAANSELEKLQEKFGLFAGGDTSNRAGAKSKTKDKPPEEVVTVDKPPTETDQPEIRFHPRVIDEAWEMRLITIVRDTFKDHDTYRKFVRDWRSDKPDDADLCIDLPDLIGDKGERKFESGNTVKWDFEHKLGPIVRLMKFATPVKKMLGVAEVAALIRSVWNIEEPGA